MWEQIKYGAMLVGIFLLLLGLMVGAFFLRTYRWGSCG